MPCVCRKTITPTQPKPASLNSYTLRSFVINMRKETAPGGQVLAAMLLASLGSHPWAWPFSWQAEEKHISLFPSGGRGAPVSAGTCHQLWPQSVQGAWAACSHLLLALPRPWMCCCSWTVSSSFWRVWSAHGTPLLLASVHECARGIFPEHLLSLVPQSTVGWVTEQIYLNSLFPRSYFSKEGNKSMTGKVLTRQKLGSSMT